MNTVSSFVKINRCFNFFIKSRPAICALRSNTTTTSNGIDVNDAKPKTISYSQSKAAKEWKSAYNYFVPPDENEVWPSNYRVISYCLAAIGVYCMVFRESNDLDEELEKPIFERLPELERPMLESALINAHYQGLPSQHLVKRLKELDAEGR